jgi:hypothetical protein
MAAASATNAEVSSNGQGPVKLLKGRIAASAERVVGDPASCQMERSCPDIHHGIKSLAAKGAVASGVEILQRGCVPDQSATHYGS